MNTSRKKTEQLDIHLSSEAKRTIESAATARGQTAGEFAISVVMREAREVLNDYNRTRLSNRDWKLFIEALEDTEAEPNEALKAAAERHNNLFR
ncbi:MAG: DUF1778 domain-containing protein [Pirellulales bacterium]|nr:DUF1778 domain-containing protein [Pirellulales bacterium]